MHLRPEDVQEIVSLLDSLSHDEFELRTSQLHIRLRRAGGEGWTQESQVLSAPNVAAADIIEAGAVTAGSTTADSTADSPTADSVTAGSAESTGTRTARRGAQDDPVPPGLTAIRAPLPGTFYRCPKPGADPYVEVGSRVREDTVVGLLETMKLFNSVYANVRGEVVEFLIDDAEPAEQDAVLILVRPEV
jgi:acetyl-CoA carboxylase biotin carboxyl carrier protein